MIAVDTNVLVYAHRREPPQHDAAIRLLGALSASPLPWAIPWPCMYEFVSVVTHTRIWKSAASTPAQAFAQLDAWASSPSLRLLGEPPDFLPTLRKLAAKPRVTGPLIHDARIAALCLAHGVHELLTADRDFSAFPSLRSRNPF